MIHFKIYKIIIILREEIKDNDNEFIAQFVNKKKVM